MGKLLDIAVVGGGTAGAASALFLADAGHQVTVFERVDQPTAIGAGILLQPTGMQVLKALGLLETVLKHAARVHRLHGTNAGGRTILDVRYADCSEESFGLGLNRGVLFSVLWDALRARGIDVRVGCPVTGLVQRRESVDLFTSDDPLGSFDCLVVADGVRSNLRSALGIRQQASAYPWGAVWALVPDPGITPGVLRQWFHRAERMLGLMPTGIAMDAGAAAQISLFWSLPTCDVPAWRAAGLQAWKEQVLALAPIGAVLDHITHFDQLSFAAYADVRMDAWHEGRVVCLGDCAHATSPQLGQGANLALVDAMVLAHCFSRGNDVAATLADYSRRRSDHLRYYQAASRWLTPFFQSHSRLASGLRDLGLGPLCRMPIAKGHMARTLCGKKSGWLWGTLELQVD